MAVAIGTILKAVSTMSLPGGNIAQNVWYWEVVGTTPVSEATILSAIATRISLAFSQVAQYIRSTVTLDTVAVHEWEWNGTDAWETGEYIGEAALSDNFTGAANMLPHACAATVSASTSDVNRTSRKSIAGLDETTQDQSDLISAVVTAVANFATQWLADVSLGGSEFLDPGLPGGDGVFYPLLVAAVSDILGSQRRRKPGIGV
jgi:hypothetical protein